MTRKGKLQFFSVVLLVCGMAAGPAWANRPKVTKKQGARDSAKITALKKQLIASKTVLKSGRLSRIKLKGGHEALFRRPIPRTITFGYSTGFTIKDPHVREVATYRSAKHLGFSVVPVTVFRSINGERGSFTEWVQGKAGVAVYGKTFSPPKMQNSIASKVDWNSVHELVLLDYVTGQRDRRADNFVFRESKGKLHATAIDNEASFVREFTGAKKSPETGMLRIAIMGAQTKGKSSLSPTLRAKLQAMDRPAIRQWRKELRDVGLSKSQIDGATRRLKRVKKMGLRAVFEHPIGVLGRVQTQGLELFPADPVGANTGK